MLETTHLILGGAFIGGLVSGLTGFGTGLVTLPIWLQAISPMLASPLVVICLGQGRATCRLSGLQCLRAGVRLRHTGGGGYMTAEVGWLVLNALPGTLIGAWIGMRLYGRLDAVRFRQVVLTLLLLAGVAMIVTAR